MSRTRLFLLLAGVAACAAAGSLTTDSSSTGRPPARPPADDPWPADRPRPSVDLYGDPLPPGAVARLGKVRFRHPGGVSSLAVSPDGRHVATVGGWRACVWVLATGGLVHEFPDVDVHDSKGAFSADGRRLLLTKLGQVTLRDVATGAVVASFHERKTGVTVAALSPEGQTVALAYDIEEKGRRVGRFKPKVEPNGPSRSAPVVSPDGATVAILEWPFGDAELVLYDVASRAEVRRFGKQLRLNGPLVFSPDGRTLAAAITRPLVVEPASAGPRPGAEPPDDRGGLILWDVATGRPRAEWGGRGTTTRPRSPSRPTGRRSTAW